ncbi:alpha-glucan family phosphorylase [Larkinella bovis]|uniref:Alpha-glucan family phosphorylase n=1 Tax=Larkinella bovis TaxID=683041 RepID=A0ABW0I7K3_9BACT
MTKSTLPQAYRHPYELNPRFKKSVAYFSMEFAIDQALKIYSGGLGFLAGSHMRSAYELKQNVIGIGILWKYGYYDQTRKTDNAMDVQFREKIYSFLEDTGIQFSIDVHHKPVGVKAYYLNPRHFNTVPMFFLTTDIDGNDWLARSISFRLYDSITSAKIAQCMLLGLGGARLLDELGYEPEVYHLNEAHAVSAAFHLFQKSGTAEDVRKRLVFTTHTPEEAGNEKHDINQLQVMSFFGKVPLETVRAITGIEDNVFNHSLAALRLSHQANAVSKLHGEVSRHMWGSYRGIPEITHVTNAQNHRYWADAELDDARQKSDGKAVAARKKELKQALFKVVADQCGKLFDPNVLTIVWARRFAAYKRPDLLVQDAERFDRLMNQTDYPIQFIWAGKPYPSDEGATHIFNSLVYRSHLYKNMAVLTGYELALSKRLKDGTDLWLNTPIVTREASGTSGMTAAMNAGINFSTFDGWVCEFAEHGKNAFIVPMAPPGLASAERDDQDRHHFFTQLENDILPLYYDRPDDWNRLTLQSMNDVNGFFNSNRMATEYYEKVY